MRHNDEDLRPSVSAKGPVSTEPTAANAKMMLTIASSETRWLQYQARMIWHLKLDSQFQDDSQTERNPNRQLTRQARRY